MTKLRKQTWTALGILFLLAVVLRLNVRQGRITGPSMSPTYENGETVLVWKTAPRSLYKPGTVIIFRDTNGDELIKRIAFIRPVWNRLPPPGSFRSPVTGRLIPYGLLFGPYFSDVLLGKKPQPAPDRTIYVLGDNLLESDDSRRIGPISPRQILGKVIP